MSMFSSGARATSPRLADKVIRAGLIYSMAENRQVYRAIAIRDEWIVAVSENLHGLDGLISSDTIVLDDPGLTIIPAFDDTHNHFILAAENLSLAPVDQATTITEFVELIRARAAQTPAGQWIRTSTAWQETDLAEGRLPTALELDAATTDHPVWVKRGGHVGVANSAALRLAGITRATPDPRGGMIKRFSDGSPNGVLLEAPAWTLVEDLIPPLLLDQRVENLRAACQAYNAHGIGTVRDPVVTRDQMRVYQALWERGGLTVRCRPMYIIARGTVEQQIADIASLGVRSGFGDDLLKIWGLKAVMDGGAEGAALEQPYIDAPGYSGNLYWKVDDLVAVANFAVRQGWKIGTHAAGDRAVRATLDAYERVIQDNPGLASGTLVIEHAMLADATQRSRAVHLGIPITVQQPLVYALGAELVHRWGEERTNQAIPIRAFLEEGVQISAGTDYPVSAYDPLQGVWGMVTRGTKKVGVRGPEYAIDQYTAIQLYTAAGAHLNGEADRRGTLQARRLADMVAYRTDPVTCRVDELLSLRPTFTLVGGRVVYDAEGMHNQPG